MTCLAVRLALATVVRRGGGGGGGGTTNVPRDFRKKRTV